MMCYPSNFSFVSHDLIFHRCLIRMISCSEMKMISQRNVDIWVAIYCFDTYLIPLPGNIFMFDS